MNHLTSPSFEEGYHYQDGIPELAVPDGWYLYYLDNQDFPGIGTSPAYRPESVVWNIQDAPQHERTLFFLDGDYCLKIFKSYGAIYFALTQHVTGLSPGARYHFTAQVFPDVVMGYDGATKVWPTDPWAAEARAGWSAPDMAWSWGILPPEEDGIQWSEWFNKPSGNFEFGQYGDVWAEFAAPANGEVRVWLECKAKWGYVNNGFFFDAWRLEAVDGEPEPPPVPVPGNGYPRVPYARKVVLLPQTAGVDWALAAAAGSHGDRNTIGYSADDAGMGPGLESREVIAVNPQEWPDDLAAFFGEYYPGAIYTPLVAETPADLELALMGGLTPVPPEPPDPPVPQPRQTRGHWGLHVQLDRSGVDRLVREICPPLMKSLIFEDATRFVNLCPDTQVILRPWLGDNYDPYIEVEDIHEGARAYIATFNDSAHAQAEQIQTNHPNRPLPCFRVEGPNELYASFIPDRIRQLVAFEVVLAEEVHAEFGDTVGYGAFNAPVGNPHESEFYLLEPLAEACMRYNGAMDYHGYWWVQHGLIEDWPWEAGRWCEMDALFASKGLAPLWYCGESGVIHSSVEGWRAPAVYNGNWARTLEDVMLFDETVAEWNRQHGNRFLGAVYFTTGRTGKWNSFEIDEPEMLALEAAMLERYP